MDDEPFFTTDNDELKYRGINVDGRWFFIIKYSPLMEYILCEYDFETKGYKIVNFKTLNNINMVEFQRKLEELILRYG